MINLELSIEREIDFMIKYNLTPDELFLFRMIWYAQEGHQEFLSKYFSENDLTNGLLNTLESLQKKGIINKTYIIPSKNTIFNPRDVDFNKNVISSFLKHSFTLGEDLWKHYPKTIIVNGRPYILKNFAKYFTSIDDLFFAYGKAIKFDPELHKEVMELLDWAIENHLISNNISDFVISRQWETIKEIKDDGSTMFDTMEAL